MADLYTDLVAERAKYGTVMSEPECVNLLNSIVWLHRHERWGLSGKDFGNFARRYDGRACSVDVIQQRPEHPAHDWEGLMVDVLRSAGAESTPTWNVLGQNTQTTRPWVAPIEPREPDAPVMLTTKLGATCFSLVDYYQHERARGEELLRHLREDLHATFLRVFWRKGTGASGDYWNNEPHRSLVRSNLQQLPVSLMREGMDWARAHGFTLAHCVFADNLGMSLSDQDRFVDGFLQAATAYADVIEYVEVFNEPYTGGGGHGGDIATLHHHARRLRAGLGPDVLLALGTPQQVHMGESALVETEVRDMYGDCPDANLITVHFRRDTNNPQLAPELGPWAPQRRSNGEPIGPDSSGAETKDAAALATNFHETNRSGYEWYVYHDGYLIRPRLGNVWERPEWPAIASALATAAGSSGGGDVPVPPVTPGPDRLVPGQALHAGQRLTSPNARFYLEYQGDGNLVIYEAGVRPLWASQSAHTPGRAEMQTDGNFVVYDASGRPRRASGTYGRSGAWLQLQDDGNLVMLDATGAVWASFSSDLFDEQGQPVETR